MFSNSIHNSQKVETIQMAINQWNDKQTVEYAFKWIDIQP
jgi:hypothetical protein